MTRRELLALPALALRVGRSIDRSRISAITDEIAPTPAEAIRFAQQYGLKWVELRGVPGSKTYYQFLSDDERRGSSRMPACGCRFSIPGC
jgi:hypothetical protein